MRFQFTISYIIFIVVLNYCVSYAPYVNLYGAPFSSGDALVGLIYVFRDLAQREIKHYVIGAMLIGSILSYFLADKTIAIASVTAFSIGELIDWSIYTFTKRPLSKRILWSASCSAPIDTGIFLYMIHQLNSVGFFVMILGKLTGVIAVWYLWRWREQKYNLSFQQI